MKLIGEFYSKLGEKNRTAFPQKFRKLLGKQVIVTRGYENCLIVVSEDQFQNLLKGVEDKEFTLSAVRDTSRFLIGGASEVDCDKQGRFVIPKNLVEHAKLKGNLVFVGLGRWVEIWDKKAWEERLSYLQKNSEKLAEDLSRMQNG